MRVRLAASDDLFGEPEVGDVRLSVVVDQDVRRLEVPVQDSVAMRVIHRATHRRQQPRRLARGSGPSASRWASVSPRTYFMLKSGRPSHSATSYTGTIPG